MKIKRPESAFQASTEPLDHQQLTEARNTAKAAFGDALSQLESASDLSSTRQSEGAGSGPHHSIRAALFEIAQRSNLSNAEQATAAVREAAHFMICSRLSEKFRESEQGGTDLADNLSEFVASDPLLKTKLLSILKRFKSQ